MRVEHLHQVFQDVVDHVLVKGAFVAVRPQVQLEGFELDHFFIRHVIDVDGGEIRLAGFGAQAGKFIGFQGNQIKAVGCAVGEGFQVFGWLGYFLPGRSIRSDLMVR